MKVGDYVRTKYGIKQIYEIDNNKTVWKYKFKLKKQDGNGCVDLGCFSDSDVIKSSPNIIDLIEENDLLKIEYYSLRYEERVTRLFEVTYKDEKYINLDNAKCDFMLIDGDWKKSDKALEPIIKSIVTKEQFSSMEYKIER